MEAQQFDLLLADGSVGFSFTDRPVRDKAWGWTYRILLATTLVPGCVALWGAGMLPPSRQTGSSGMSSRLEVFSVLVTVACAALALGFATVQAIRLKPAAMLVVPAVLLCAIGGVVCLLLAGQPLLGILLVVATVGAAGRFCSWRPELEMASRVLQLAGTALHQNTRLLCALMSLLLGTLLLGALLVIFIGASVLVIQGSHICEIHDNTVAGCWLWLAKPFWIAYASWCGFMIFWTLQVYAEVQRFVVSAAAAQWYFAPQHVPLNGTVRRALRLALTSSFGTCVFSSATRSFTERFTYENDRFYQHRRCTCPLAFILNRRFGMDYITRFALVRAAIVGEAFLTAAHNAMSVFQRNALTHTTVWSVHGAAVAANMLCSVSLGVATYGVRQIYWPHGDQGPLLGFLAFFVALFAQWPFTGALMTVLDVIFMCYSMDMDMKIVTDADMHDVVSQSQVGAAVVNPDGDYSYGAPLQPHNLATNRV